MPEDDVAALCLCLYHGLCSEGFEVCLCMNQQNGTHSETYLKQAINLGFYNHRLKIKLFITSAPIHNM